MKKVLSSRFKVQSSPIFISLLFTLQSLFLAAVAFAEEGGEEHVSLFKAYFWPVINFALLVALLVYALKKADIKGYFKKRTELIEQSLKEAREAKELAQKALAQVEERLRVKDKEMEEIIASARMSGEKEKARLAEEGAKLQEKILEQAKTNIDFEVKQAKSAIKQEAAELAMELAEKKLKEKLTKEEQLKLLEESVAKIEGKN
jgi:F-type H+-transporting ATPase subunit b